MIDPQVVVKANYNRTLITVRVTAINSPDWVDIVGTRIDLAWDANFSDVFYTKSTTHYKTRAYIEGAILIPARTVYARVTMTKNDDTTHTYNFDFVLPYPLIGTVADENGTLYVTSIRKMSPDGTLSPRNYSNRAVVAGSAAYIDIMADAAGNMMVSNQWTTPVIVQNITRGTAEVELVGDSRNNYTMVAVSKDDIVRVTEGSAGATFREFTRNGNNPLCKNVTAHITYMPSMDRFTIAGDNTMANDYFFAYFNYRGTLTSLPEGSFDTHHIEKGTLHNNSQHRCEKAFLNFNSYGALTSLPEGSFDFFPITWGFIASDDFSYFNDHGALTSLPEGSFDFDNLWYSNSNVFDYFNQNGALTSLPEGSFGFSSCVETTGSYNRTGLSFNGFNSYGALTSLPAGAFHFKEGSTRQSYFQNFNNHGALTSLPEHSFNFIISASGGYISNLFNGFNAYGALTSLPAGSFRFGTNGAQTMYWSCFNNFNDHGALTSLPVGSFNTDNVKFYYSVYFNNFNAYGALTSLPEGSFNFDNATGEMRDNCFAGFNYYGSLKSLPKGSFNFKSLTSIGTNFCGGFNRNGALERLPINAFSVNNVTSIRNQQPASAQPFNNFNLDGKLPKSNTHYNPDHIFPTAASQVSVDAYYYDPDTQTQTTETVSQGNPFKYFQSDYFTVTYTQSTAYTTDLESEYLSGSSYTFTATSTDPEYYVTPTIVTEGGTSVPVIDNGDNTFTFEMPEDNIEATFAVHPYPAVITIVADEAGTMVVGNKWTTPVIVENITQGTSPVTVASQATESVAVDVDDEITVTESSAGITFRNWTSTNSPIAKGVSCHISEMPPMRKFTENTTGTTAGEFFFHAFNFKGTVSSLPADSFDISGITTTKQNFFTNFNREGSLTALPVGSFNTSNLAVMGAYCFSGFNYSGELVVLPDGSFDFSNAEFDQNKGMECFSSFNNRGKLTSLPDGSFRFPKFRVSPNGGSQLFSSFNMGGAITALPAGSFDTSEMGTTSAWGIFLNFNNRAYSGGYIAGKIKKSTTSYNPNFINPYNSALDAHYWTGSGSSSTTESIQPGDPFYFETS